MARGAQDMCISTIKTVVYHVLRTYKQYELRHVYRCILVHACVYMTLYGAVLD